MDSSAPFDPGTTGGGSVPGAPQLRKSKRIESQVEPALEINSGSQSAAALPVVSAEIRQKMELIHQQIAQMTEQFTGDILKLVISNVSVEMPNSLCANINQPITNYLVNVVNKSYNCVQNASALSEAMGNVEAVFDDSQSPEAGSSQMAEVGRQATTSRKSHKQYSVNKCDQCSNSFSTIYNLERHQKVHRDSKAFACEICGDKFKYREELSRHLMSKHQKKLVFQCDICIPMRTFTFNGNLKRHMANMHSQYLIKNEEEED